MKISSATRMTKLRRSLSNRNILLGVTGSVAAYKAVDLVRRLKDTEASVSVVMTDASSRFITPLSLEVASGNKVYAGLFDDPLAHIDLARDADLLLIAPATANTIGKLAAGVADDLLSTLYLAYTGPCVVAPAMNWRMYGHPVFRRNLAYLKSIGVTEVPPEDGDLACGEQGKGRMAEIMRIVDYAEAALSEQDLAGKKVVVTAGPTREFMDEVRFVSNRSSGRMGYALARAAWRRGAQVTLISGPSALPYPREVEFISVTGAQEMRDAVLRAIKGVDALFMVAAVADLAPEKAAEAKPDKRSLRKSIKVQRTPDILAEIGRMKKRPFLVGFAAEAGNRLDRARKKMIDKGADLMVFNDITEPDAGFEAETNRVVIIDAKGEESYPLLNKSDVADVVLTRAFI